MISHHLLQVNAGHRLAVANALRHQFFEDYQMFCDLRKLEDSCSCERWLTSSEDDDKWEQYAKDNGANAQINSGRNFVCFLFEKNGFIFKIESSLTLTLPTKNFLRVHPTANKP